MLRSIALASFILLMSNLSSQAQEVFGQPKFEYSTKDPTIQKMQQFLDLPVNYFTGAVNISIPLYTVTTKGNNLPLSLDYNTGGIKATEQFGYGGVGWSLHGGGSITRVVRGNPDDGLGHELKRRKLKMGVSDIQLVWATPLDSLADFFHRYGGYYIDVSNGLGTGSIHDAIADHNYRVDHGNPYISDELPLFFAGLIDGEPDLFYFNFGNYSGKFIFDREGNPLLMPNRTDLKITPVVDQLADVTIQDLGFAIDTIYRQQFSFSSFKISTPDGKDYYFGESGPSRSTYQETMPYVYDAWYLTKVVDRATQDTITLEYNGVQSGSLQLRYIDKFINQYSTTSECVNGFSTRSDFLNASVNDISKITSSREILDFSGGGITVKDRGTGKSYRTIQFDQGGFLSGRFKLKGIIINDLQTNEYYPYTFKYYDTAGYAGFGAQDYWGYHNGVPNTISSSYYMMSSYTGCTTYGANRDPAWPAMKLDALTEINYPTGGKTMLEYEPHTAYTGRMPDNSIRESDAFVGGVFNSLTLPHIVGGLRIKRMLSYDPVTGDTLIKRFSYIRPGDGASSGHLYIPPSTVMEIHGFTCGAIDDTHGPYYHIATENQYKGSGSGPHLSYSHVQVQEEKNGVSNGRTEYDYFDDLNTDSSFYSNAISSTSNSPLADTLDVLPNWICSKIPENYLSGREKGKRVYNAAGDLLIKETITYKARIDPALHGIADCYESSSVLKNNICGVSLAIHDPGPAATTPDWPRMPPPLSYYFCHHYRIRRVGVQQYQKIVETHASPTSISIDTTTYFYDDTLHMNPTRIVTRNSKSEVTMDQVKYSLDFNEVNSGDSAIYFMKKASMNLPLARFTYNNGNITAGGYRNYKLKSRMDSTVFLPSDEYALDVPGNGIAPATINVSNTIPQALNFPAANFQKVATYLYRPDNTIGTVIKKGNEKLALIWDYNKNFVIAETAGADSTDIAFTGFETNYNGSWIVASTARVTTSFLTGKQSYNLSNGNVVRNGLNAAKSYLVTYWSSSGSATINGASGVAGVVKRGWHYYEHLLPASTTTITISGTVSIDELRLLPATAQMTTYAFDPVVGVTSKNSVNNTITYFEYDGSGRLRFIRDADNNIIKAAQYFFTGYSENTAVWRSAGASRRPHCSVDTSFMTKIIEVQQIDINPNSSTYGTLRWVNGGSCGCDVSVWQNTVTAQRCVKDGSNNNTGAVEQEQKNINPCDDTYNQTRWVPAGTNTTTCPLPCIGIDKQIINGFCSTGIRVDTHAVFDEPTQKWKCIYHYEWYPDCIKGSDITEYNDYPCSIDNNCIPQ